MRFSTGSISSAYYILEEQEASELQEQMNKVGK
jgi:uncharacterized membrane protein